MRTDLKILLVGIMVGFIVAFLFFSGAFKPLTPEQQAERQKKENASLMTIFEDSVFLKNPKTGECVEAFFKKDADETETINRLVAVRTCDCAKVPPEILITAEVLKKPQKRN